MHRSSIVPGRSPCGHHVKHVCSVKQNICSVALQPGDVNMTSAMDQKASARERPLMEATLRIIGRKGIDGVTHRAAAAGMSGGAVTHHFGTRDSLVDAALRYALSREVGRLRALAISLQSSAFDCEAWISALVDW